MGKRIVAVAGFALLLAATPVLCQEVTHHVTDGDTLWDISEKYWQDSGLWPELWSVNPQLHNPHWIYPGEEIYLQRPDKNFVARRVVRLPLEKLMPEPAPETAAEAAGGGGGDANVSAAEEGKADGGPRIRLTRRESLDYVSSHRLSRLGVVANTHQFKETYGAGEDLEFQVNPEAGMSIGDVVSIFDDVTPVVHPLSLEPQGYYVEVLGHMEVLGVIGDRGVGSLNCPEYLKPG